MEANRRFVHIRKHGVIGGKLAHPDRYRIGIVDVDENLASVPHQHTDAAMQGRQPGELGWTELAQAGIE